MNTYRISRWFGYCVALLAADTCLQAQVANATLTLTSPLSCQVFQRDPRDQADILIEGAISDTAEVIEAKADLSPGAKRGASVTWTAITAKGPGDQGKFSGRLTLQAGGWYQVSIRARMGTRMIAEQVLDKVGVGEVLITAGKDYGFAVDGFNDSGVTFGSKVVGSR